jgi:hypothetical protein
VKQLCLPFSSSKPRETREYWESLLRQEGMPDEPRLTKVECYVGRHKRVRSSELDERVDSLHARQLINVGVLEMAERHLRKHRWDDSWERKVWALFCEGETVRGTARTLHCAKSLVGRVIKRHRKKAGIDK